MCVRMCVYGEGRVPYLEKHIQWIELVSFRAKRKILTLGSGRQGTSEERVQTLVPDDGLQAYHLQGIVR